MGKCRLYCTNETLTNKFRDEYMLMDLAYFNKCEYKEGIVHAELYVKSPKILACISEYFGVSFVKVKGITELIEVQLKKSKLIQSSDGVLLALDFEEVR